MSNEMSAVKERLLNKLPSVVTMSRGGFYKALRVQRTVWVYFLSSQTHNYFWRKNIE